MQRTLTTAALVAALLYPATRAAAQDPSAEETLLTIGSEAPAIDIEHWVSTGDGKFEPITEFADGQVYVVEFWATWCPPCIRSMPHISELQQKYAEQGVTVVSVSNEPLETVTNFLEREVEGKITDAGEPLTFAEVTKHYCLTTDPDGSVSTDYMQAAKQSGIPCAFIVGKDGHIEWLGHPMSMDEPLEMVVTDQWDREAYAEKFKAEQEFKIASQKIMREVAGLLGKGEVEQAMAAYDAYVAAAPNDQLRAQAQARRISIEFMVFQSLVRNDQAGAVDQLAKLIKMAGGAPGAVNQITWAIARHVDAGNEVSEPLLNAGIAAIEEVLDASNPNPSMLDTLAHLTYAKGDLDGAIELQEKAAAGATGRLKRNASQFLEKLKAEKEGPAEEAGDTEEEDTAETQE